MRFFAYIALVVVMVFVAGPAGVAQAQSKHDRAAPKKGSAAAVDPQQEIARAAYRRGQRAFGVASYEEAALAFEEAFAAIPNPVVLLSIAECHAKAGQPLAASAALKKYLTLRPDAPDRANVEKTLAGLSATPARLSVTSDPPNVDLDLDGLTHARTPAQLELSPGQHELRYTSPGYVGGHQQITAEAGAQQTLHLTLDVMPVQQTSAPLELEAKATRPMTAIWISGGIGTAGLLTGAVLGFLAIQKYHDFQVSPSNAAADSGEQLALGADVALGIGIVGLATAAVLYLISDDTESCTQ